MFILVNIAISKARQLSKWLRLSLSENDAQRFLQEAQTLVRLRHAHIVRVLDFAIEDNTPVLIMDYISGGSLHQHHPQGTCLLATYHSRLHRADRLCSAICS